MNKKQYRITLIVFGVSAIGLLVTDIIWEYVELLWVFIAVSIGYIFIRYRVTTPLQKFSAKFNMLVDYDLDVEGALALAKNQYENAPTASVSQLLSIYLGMGYYYNSEYDEAIKTFNQISLNKVNQVYHILIHAFTAYSAYEINDREAFDVALERMENAKQRIHKKYFAFASSYMEILEAMKNLEINPENYREVIERNFSREDGYISTRLIYNYRMAMYYKTVGNEEEMDKCLAKVIANGKNHHTALRSRSMFKGTVNVEDYVFTEASSEPKDVVVVEEPLQIDEVDDFDTIKDVEYIEDAEVMDELFDEPVKKANSPLASMSVSELRDICRNKGVAGYYKMKKADLIAEIEKLEE
jgi:tetratricopeptide (TPR) repeat protein